MTNEEKQLLLKDLCARLPYSVWGLHRGKDLPLYVIDNYGTYMVLGYDAWFDLKTVSFKPYLRPMSSMTEEEKEEVRLYFRKSIDELKGKPHEEQFILGFCQDAIILDWLNAHHFDYRGLIERGLALEAPDNMYKTE